MKALLLTLLLTLPSLAAATRVMPVGDSITEGGAAFSNYRFQLWEKLSAAGYQIDYTGSRKSDSRIGPLAHEGYSGKNASFLAATVVPNFKTHPADIVLLHAGHNYDAQDKPVPEIIEATETMIKGFRAVNPKVAVLLAQPIPSGKLPKYSYIPDLHAGLARLAGRLDRPASRVILVPMDKDFDPAKDTVADLVHPNASGAAKMADHWFQAITPLLAKPAPAIQPKIIPYKKTSKGDLTLHVFSPPGPSQGKKRPAIVFFFGGGWKLGTPLQFYPECAYFASKGMVAITADYRIAATHGTTPFDAVADAKSAIRWVRQHAADLGVDPDKIAAAGASAGGHLAAAAGNLPGLDDPADDLGIRSTPDAAILWYPVLDNGPDGYSDPSLKSRYQEISPLHHAGKHSPPTLIFLGTRDRLVPVRTAENYQKLLRDAGVRCELKLFEGGVHPLYEYRQGESPLRGQILTASSAFLDSIHFR